DFEDDRNRRGRRLGHKSRWCVGRSGDHGNPASNQFGYQFRQPVELILGPAIFDRMAYFASVAAFSINAATSGACERKIAWLPGSSMTCDCARFVMNRSRSGLIIRSCMGITA